MPYVRPRSGRLGKAALNHSLAVIDGQTAGISGDMMLGALIDAGANLEAIKEVLRLIPKNFPRCQSLEFETREVKKLGFRACSVDFTISERDEETSGQELIDSTHAIANASKLSEKARYFAIAAIELLVDVEGTLHGLERAKAHLHEAGSTDTLADVFGVAAACDSLEIFENEVLATPVAIGSGLVSFSHGTLGTPAPAVLEIARKMRIPIVGGPDSGELATPTGVSLLASITDQFVATFPAIIAQKVGYGAGKKDLVKTPNVLRVILGQSTSLEGGSGAVQVVETNIDDVPGEILGHALQRVLDSGARDAWITPALFKKNRPGHVLHAICDLSAVERIADVIIKETGTFGVRFHQWNRITLQREVRTVKLQIAGRSFEARVKLAKDESGRIVRMKPEFDDVRGIAEAVSKPAREISNLVMREMQQVEEREG